MKEFVSVFTAIYSFMIRLYPRPFREEFGGEMEAVFQEEVADAATHSRILVLQAGWRELRDWPLHCFRAHWQVRQGRLMASSAQPLSWWDAVMSGIPFFLLAFILAWSTLLFLFDQTSGVFVSLLLTYGFVFILLLVITLAWWRGWPNWSAAWLGFILFVLLVLFLPGQLFTLLGQEPDMQPVQMMVTEAGLPLLWLAVLYVLLYRWPRAGLIAMLPTLGMAWFLYLEFVPETLTAFVLAATWIWLGLVAVVLLRWRHHAWDVWLLYLAAVVVGMIYIFAGHFLTEMIVRERTFSRMSEDLISDLLPALIPLVGILLLHTLRLWSRANGRVTTTNYRLIFAAVFLMVIGVQNLLLVFRRGNTLSWQWSMGSLFTAILLFGWLLMIIAIGLMVKSRPRWQLSVGWPIWLLLGLLLILPLVFDTRWLSVAYTQLTYQRFSPGVFSRQGHESLLFYLRQAGQLTGILWLLLAGWVFGRVRSQLPPGLLAKFNGPEPAATLQAAAYRLPKPDGLISKRRIIYLLTGLLILAVLLMPLTTLASFFPNDQAQTFELSNVFPIFLLMSTALVIAAPLLSSGLRIYKSGPRRTAALFLVLCALLLIKAMHSFYWLIVWDSTTDSLGFMWLFIPVSAVFLGAIWLTFSLPERAKLAAFLYLLLIPPLLIVVSGLGQRVDTGQLTESRARRVSQALKAHYDQEGQYPEDLGHLSPRYLTSLSEPVVIFGQEWCYDGGGNDYSLGYVYREHWSDPRLVALVYSTAAVDSRDRSQICDEEIIALQARDPQYYGFHNR